MNQRNLLRQLATFPPPLAVFLVTLLLYSSMAAQDLTWAFYSGDGGELITAVMTNGIPHPPGYPTYLLLGKIVAHLPFMPIAFRFALFSAFCGAVAAAIVTAIAKLLGVIGWQTVWPGLTVALVPLIWQQAIIVEVYALNLAFISLLLWSLIGQWPPWLTGLILGICLTTHLTSLLLLPLTLLLTPKNQWLPLFVGLFIGLTPFFILPLLDRGTSPISWGNPQTVAGWWWLVSAKIYRPNQFALPITDIWLRLREWIPSLLQQLFFIGWILLFFSFTVNKKRVWIGLVVTGLAYLTYAFFYNTKDSIVLTLPAWLLFSLALTPTFKRLHTWGFLLPLCAILLNFNLINSADIHNIRPFAEQILNSSPANAILITSGDPDIFAMWYFLAVEKQRPDLIVIDDRLLAFKWYRERQQKIYPSLKGLDIDDIARFRQMNVPQRPICTVSLGESNNLSAYSTCIEERSYDGKSR